MYNVSNLCAVNRTDEMLADGLLFSEIIDYCQQCLEADPVSDVDITIILWHSVMSAVEWNKKEDLLAKQAMEHLQVFVYAHTMNVSMCLHYQICGSCIGMVSLIKSLHHNQL